MHLKFLEAAAVRKALDECLAPREARGGDRHTEFCRRVYADGLDRYRRRIEAHGFTGMRRVLDLGSGFGQWSLCLAERNAEVDAVDLSADRVSLVGDLARRLGVDNLAVHRESASATGFADASFDAVFSYSTVFLTPWRETVREIARVLAPGGVVYLNANGFGWYKFLWRTRHNESADYDPRAWVVETLRNTLAYERNNGYVAGQDVIVEPDEMRSELEAAGFAEVEVGAEGTVFRVSPPPLTGSFFAGEYGGDVGVYEVMATRSA
jgi:SAM-dependent methyltransferase